jgi:hypothetical protein
MTKIRSINSQLQTISTHSSQLSQLLKSNSILETTMFWHKINELIDQFKTMESQLMRPIHLNTLKKGIIPIISLLFHKNAPKPTLRECPILNSLAGGILEETLRPYLNKYLLNHNLKLIPWSEEYVTQSIEQLVQKIPDFSEKMECLDSSIFLDVAKMCAYRDTISCCYFSLEQKEALFSRLLCSEISDNSGHSPSINVITKLAYERFKKSTITDAIKKYHDSH